MKHDGDRAASESMKQQTPSVLRVALYSLLFNLSLLGAKLFLSSLTGSLALRADAVHPLVDHAVEHAPLPGKVELAGFGEDGRGDREDPGVESGRGSGHRLLPEVAGPSIIAPAPPSRRPLTAQQ